MHNILFDPALYEGKAHTCSFCRTVFVLDRKEVWVANKGMPSQYFQFNCPKCKDRITKAVL